VNEFAVVRLNRSTFDVFQGKQWGDWSRLRSGRNGVYVAKGRSLPHAVTRALASAIDPRCATQQVSL
jgi:hypothetical protein